MQFAGSVYDSNQALQQGQVNPWIAGLSTGASAVGAYSALGGGKPAPNAAENFYNRYWGTGG